MVGALPLNRAKELGHDLIRRMGDDGLDNGVLVNWAGDDPDRASVLAWTAWGTIRWDRALGRPRGRRLADGFASEHQAELAGHIATSGPDKTEFVPVHDVALFDLPMDGDFFQVGYECHSWHPLDGGHNTWQLWDGYNRVLVALAPGEPWIAEGVPLTDRPVHLWVQPSGALWMARREHVILDPVEVR